MQQPHYQHASVSPSPSTTVSTSFQGTDNDMTPAISALEIRHYPHQDNVSETGSASRPPQQHGDGYISWSKADGLLSHRTLTVPVGHRGPGDNSEEIIRRLSHSSAGSEVNTIRSASSISMFDDNDMVQYSLEARIIQKKDQLEELSATGAIIPTPIVEEVRTGQQFLIKIHLSKNSSSLPSRFPALRVGRREAINTAGEARSEPEPLTLEIAVHLAKSSQTRKGACAKCCHKYGPSSPILVLLDPLSPSVTDPVNYAHIDTTSGSITMLAKVLCSSTDHGERGNKDRYIFEFRLKSTSSMPLIPSSTLSTSDASSRASEAPEDEGDTVSSCFTQPIMCSGHHKAKRVYPHQRPIKTPKGVPTPKTKTIKRHKSVPTITMPHQGGSHSMTGETSSSSDHLVDSCPRITEVRPSHGPIRKTTDVVLRGLAFREGMVPYFGCFPALDIIVETANLMVCKAPESPLPGTVGISIYDHLGNSFSDLGQFTYTDDSETELLILQLQLRLAHRALEYMHTRATGQKGNAADILREIPGLATSPRSGSVLMMDAREGLTEATEATEAIVVDGEVDEDMPLMTLAQIEESIMNTLDNVPRGMDISVQLDDGTNMLHLAILLGFNYLAVRLIEEGCDLEALDAWSMTPLMYTVLKGNEAIARILVIAGASSSGASTPQEFYARLPRQVEPTQAMYNFLSVSCTRFSGSPRLYTLESATFDSEMAAVEEQDDEEEEWTETSSDSSIETVPIARSVVTPPLIKAEDESSASTLASPEATIGPSEGGAGQKQLTDLASTIQGVRVTPFMPPLDQQDLPPLQKVEEDGSVTINSKVVQGAEIYGGHGAELFRNVNPESGYHSGVYSEVQEQLNRLHLTTLPSEGVQMSVSLKKLTPSSSSATRRQQSSSTVISAMPLELFRTGDSFGVEIKLGSSDAQVPMPKECLGLRFPHEMVKRVSGRPASILTEMTYILRATVELGKTSMALTPEQSSSAAEEQGHGHEQEEHYGDGIPLIGSCQACSKFLHEHKKLSPSRRSQTDPSVYPVLQFSIPGGSSTNPTTTATTTTTTAMAAAAAASSAGVVELRDGVCEIKAKVNCSSLHHLIQRERARRIAELKRRQQEAVASVTSTTCATESSSTNTTTTATSTTKTKKSSLAMTDLQDPGFVFKFEVVHPTLGTVVARCETKPILFQSYSRGREGK
ncbi:SPT3 Dosage dependent suppressor of Ty-induced promoter mutations-like protein [Mortierella sp. AD031]|nr:SPT3 Dosage dependent suppressor of Ty-induced promoter mutations-like protein [Mortierella sp. AD031]